MIPTHSSLRAGVVAVLMTSMALGCEEPPTPAGAEILDWHRSSASSEPGVTLGDDLGPATEETQSGTLAVGPDEVRYTLHLEVGEIRGGAGEGLPPVLRGPRRIRVIVDDSRGHVVTASCLDALALTRVEGGEGYQPDLAATCTIQVGAEAVKVFMLRAAADTPSAPPPSDEAEAP
ncbi:MAG: hypothetical protein KC619_35260 [Myxococcales bacterium]|nr:hypothetical protein [Myxococcales bacterium]